MDAFWRQTPRRFRHWLDSRLKAAVADHRHKAWMVWTGEQLARVKTLPAFERFVGKDPMKKKQTPEEMMAILSELVGGPPEAEA